MAIRTLEIELSHRTIAIGDIHGCSRALAALLKVVEPTSDDIIIQLGDTIDRGPDSRSVVEQLIELSSQCSLICVRGNHEELLLNSLDDAAELPRWLRNGGFDTLQSYDCNDPALIPEQHLNFIRSSIDYLELESVHFYSRGIRRRPTYVKTNTVGLAMATNKYEFATTLLGKSYYCGTLSPMVR